MVVLRTIVYYSKLQFYFNYYSFTAVYRSRFLPGLLLNKVEFFNYKGISVVPSCQLWNELVVSENQVRCAADFVSEYFVKS